MMTGIIRMPMAKLPRQPGKADAGKLYAPLVEADDEHLVGEDAEQDRGKSRHYLGRRAQHVGRPRIRLGEEQARYDPDRDREEGRDAVDDERADEGVGDPSDGVRVDKGRERRGLGEKVDAPPMDAFLHEREQNREEGHEGDDEGNAQDAMTALEASMRRLSVLCATCWMSSRRSIIGSGGTPSIVVSRHTNARLEAERRMRRRPNQFTTAVSTIKITARAPRAATCSGVGVLELEGDGRSEGGGGRKQRMGKQRVQADDHGDRHGLTERSRGGERHGADNAGLGGRQHHLAQYLPLRRAHAEGALELVVRAPPRWRRGRGQRSSAGS